MVPLFWNSRHTRTSQRRDPTDSPRAAHRCQENTESAHLAETGGTRSAQASTYRPGGRSAISNTTFSCSCSKAQTAKSSKPRGQTGPRGTRLKRALGTDLHGASWESCSALVPDLQASGLRNHTQSRNSLGEETLERSRISARDAEFSTGSEGGGWFPVNRRRALFALNRWSSSGSERPERCWVATGSVAPQFLIRHQKPDQSGAKVGKGKHVDTVATETCENVCFGSVNGVKHSFFKRAKIKVDER